MAGWRLGKLLPLRLACPVVMGASAPVGVSALLPSGTETCPIECPSPTCGAASGARKGRLGARAGTPHYRAVVLLAGPGKGALERGPEPPPSPTCGAASGVRKGRLGARARTPPITDLWCCWWGQERASWSEGRNPPLLSRIAGTAHCLQLPTARQVDAAAMF